MNEEHNIPLIRINLSAIPSRRCVRITLKLVICPCGTPSAGSSSIFASTYPTTFGYCSLHFPSFPLPPLLDFRLVFGRTTAMKDSCGHDSAW
jgi:hypothetical protein